MPQALKPYIRIDEEGYLDFSLPYEGNETLVEAFDDWKRSACPHPDMEFASERLANWSGCRAFQDALAAAGADRFPALLRELPDANGGMTLASAARTMLTEIEAFEKLAPFGHRFVLIDSVSGAELAECVESHGGVFGIGPDDFHLGIDQDGFFIRRTMKLLFGLIWERTLFRSRRFEQHLHERHKAEAFESTPVTYRDLGTGTSFTCTFPVMGDEIPWPDGRMENDEGKSCFHYPTRMHAEPRVRGPEQFAYITQPLKVICRASVETGNPIRWG